MRQLFDLPDVLLDQVADGLDAISLHRLICVSKRSRRQFHPHFCLAMLFGPGLGPQYELKTTRPLIEQLDVLARSFPDIVTRFRHRVNIQGAFRFLDRVLFLDSPTLDIVPKLIKTFSLDIFHDIFPGIYFDVRSRCTFLMKVVTTVKRLYSVFEVKPGRDRIRIELQPEIEVVLREYLRSHPGRFEVSKYRKLSWASVFEPDIIALMSAKNGHTDKIHETLLRDLSHSELLKQPSVLHSLARIGIRFDAEEYLNAVPVSPKEFKRVVEFLSPCGPIWYDSLVDKLLLNGRAQGIFPTLFGKKEANIWLHFHFEGGRATLRNMLKQKRFADFCTLGVNVTWKYELMEKSPGLLLMDALEYDAPREVLDLILSSQWECLDDVRVNRLRCRDEDSRKYVVLRLNQLEAQHHASYRATKMPRLI